MRFLVLLAVLLVAYTTVAYPSENLRSYFNTPNGYVSYGGYYPSYNSYYYPTYQPIMYGSPYGIYPGYGGWMNPMGTGSGWAAGGGVVGNALSFLIG